MTAEELYSELTPNKTEIYKAQVNTSGLCFDSASLFTTLIKEAARCNDFSSDIFYDLEEIHDKFRKFKKNSKWEPMFVGFRRHGVDASLYILKRIENNPNALHALSSAYFALFCINVLPGEYDDWKQVEVRTYFL